jgi:hypothetical protein
VTDHGRSGETIVMHGSAGFVAGSDNVRRESGRWSGRVVVVEGWRKRSKLIFGFNEYLRTRLIDDGTVRTSSGTGGNGERSYGEPACFRGGGVSGGGVEGQ